MIRRGNRSINYSSLIVTNPCSFFILEGKYLNQYKCSEKLAREITYPQKRLIAVNTITPLSKPNHHPKELLGLF
jgi:hypothetical protein